ncbi:MAG: hypothetical protein WC926_03300 [Candidatus Paceibacterota bacterium]|jgi:adenylate kinase family enzyme
MHESIIFIFGPSGVGKSFYCNLIKNEYGYSLLKIDTDNNGKNTFAAYGFPLEWDKSFLKVDFKYLLDELKKRYEVENKGIIVSFPTTYRITSEKIDSLKQLGVIPILLWGTEENCKLSAIERMRRKGREFDEGQYFERYDERNSDTFKIYKQSQYDPFRIEAFRPDGSRFSGEEIKNKITDFILKFSN